jgi:hypothetical protein
MRGCRCPFDAGRFAEEIAAGGVFRMKVNDRSSKIVSWAGMI